MEHFADEFIIVHNKKSLLKWNLPPVPTIYQTKNCTLPSPLPPSVLPTVSPARKPPTVRNTTQEDEIQRFTKEDICSSVNNFTEKHCPVGFTFRKLLQYLMRQLMLLSGVTSLDEKMQLLFFIYFLYGGQYPIQKLDIILITIWEMELLNQTEKLIFC